METQSAVVETSWEGILESDHGVDKGWWNGNSCKAVGICNLYELRICANCLMQGIRRPMLSSFSTPLCVYI